GAAVIVELLSIIATVLGLATSFGFAAMQFSSGLTSFTGLTTSPMMWLMVILIFAGITSTSAIVGINKGMARISGLNSILSIALVAAVLIFGPSLYIISNMSQTFGSFFTNFANMSLWTDSGLAATTLDSWQD